MYLNQIYFGQGAYEGGGQSDLFRERTVKVTGLAESAFLAGLPKSPSHYSPFKAYDRAKKRCRSMCWSTGWPRRVLSVPPIVSKL